MSIAADRNRPQKHIQRALIVLRSSEVLTVAEVVPDALLGHLAPLGWQHINLTGDYVWGGGTAVGPDGFRPLRGTSAKLLAATA